MKKYKVPLAVNQIGKKEIEAVTNCLKKEKTTMDIIVKEFEDKFAKYIGCKHAIMVNSGSSANLLAVSVLSNALYENRIKPGDEVIVPAVSWSTTVFPIIQHGAIPVFVDCGVDYQIDVDKIESVITDKTKAIFIVNILGNLCDMRRIMKICDTYNLFLIEDNCESLGSKYGDKHVGNFGKFGTFSFYFTHHLSTIEGGMLVTNDSELYDTAKVMRSHGYVRFSDKIDDYKRAFPNIDQRFMFINLGYNFRPMELQAAIGLVQLEKLDGYLKTRRESAIKITKALEKYEEYFILPREKPNTTHSWFAYPLTVKPNDLFGRRELMSFLETSGIETRPLIAGNLVEQPVFQSGDIDYKSGELPNARNVMRHSFYIGNHPKVDVEHLIKSFDNFFKVVKHH